MMAVGLETLNILSWSAIWTHDTFGFVIRLTKQLLFSGVTSACVQVGSGFLNLMCWDSCLHATQRLTQIQINICICIRILASLQKNEYICICFICSIWVFASSVICFIWSVWVFALSIHTFALFKAKNHKKRPKKTKNFQIKIVSAYLIGGIFALSVICFICSVYAFALSVICFICWTL